MLASDIAKKVIDESLSLGADFVDIFVERNEQQIIKFASNKVEENLSGIDFGIGLRLVYGTNSVYAYTNIAELGELIRLARLLSKVHSGEAHSFEGFNNQPPVKQISAYNDSIVPLDEKIQTLSKMNDLIRSKSEFVAQANVGLLQRSQHIEVFDSEGLYVKDHRPYIRFSNSVILKDGEKNSSSFMGPGARGGWDFSYDIDFDHIATDLIETATTTLHAKPCPAGTMPVVIDGGFGGVIFHEACGHILETTSVEKKASIFWDSMGEIIANEALSAVDDGTIDKEWGSLSIDDEGMETQKTQLIKDGKLVNFLSDRMGEIKTGHKRTGSARRQSYKNHPASRMRNTYIEPGKFSLEDLIGDLDDGLYAKKMGGGSVNPGTGEFNFSVEEGYLVKDGRITQAVKGATLIGKGEDILTKISKVANNFSFSAGMCGSVSGAIPVTVGQPAIKVDSILVGGRA
jgi:TldD protein